MNFIIQTPKVQVNLLHSPDLTTTMNVIPFNAESNTDKTTQMTDKTTQTSMMPEESSTHLKNVHDELIQLVEGDLPHTHADLDMALSKADPVFVESLVSQGFDAKERYAILGMIGRLLFEPGQFDSTDLTCAITGPCTSGKTLFVRSITNLFDTHTEMSQIMWPLDSAIHETRHVPFSERKCNVAVEKARVAMNVSKAIWKATECSTLIVATDVERGSMASFFNQEFEYLTKAILVGEKVFFEKKSSNQGLVRRDADDGPIRWISYDPNRGRLSDLLLRSVVSYLLLPLSYLFSLPLLIMLMLYNNPGGRGPARAGSGPDKADIRAVTAPHFVMAGQHIPDVLTTFSCRRILEIPFARSFTHSEMKDFNVRREARVSSSSRATMVKDTRLALALCYKHMLFKCGDDHRNLWTVLPKRFID